MRSGHFIRAAAAALAVALPASPRAQAPTQLPDSSNFTIFFRGAPIGTEQIALTRNADGWIVASSGRMGAPLDIVARRVEVRYTEDWQPVAVTIDATSSGQPLKIQTVVGGTTAQTHMVRGDQAADRTDTIAPGALLLPSPFWGPYEALAARLKNAAQGTVIPALGSSGPVTIRVGDSSIDRIQTPARLVESRRTRITLVTATGPLDGDIWTEGGRLMRLSIPAQNVDVVRDDIASVSSRRVTISRQNDEAVKIAANGFILAGTLSKPAAAPAGKLPSILLVGGAEQTDRDGGVGGVPIFGELAGALADRGFAVLRYDKRGIGQSGGRSEAAAVSDYADDVRAAVQFLRNRKDLDDNRIAVAGHGEGGSVAMLAASKDKKIAALVLVGAMGVTGVELNMAQVEHELERSNKPEADRQATIDLQKRIQAAVLTGKGWEGISPVYRRQADTPWFQSFLAFNPAAVMADVRQPVLIVQGMLDTQMPPSNADALEKMARARKKQAPVDVARVAGVNHLMLPQTGDAGDVLPPHVSADVVNAIASWLPKAFSAPK